MKTESTYRWRVQDGAGRWYTTRWNATEADIRREHPEAMALPHTRIERQVPETADELWARGQPGLSCSATATPDSAADRLARGLVPYDHSLVEPMTPITPAAPSPPHNPSSNEKTAANP